MDPVRGVLRAVVPALLAAGIGGCFSMQTVEPGTAVDSGTEARVELTADGAERLPRRAPLRSDGVRGRILAWSADSVRISYTVSALGGSSPPRRIAPLRDTVSLPREAVRSVAVSRLEPVRSVLLAGGVVGGVALGFVAAASSGGDRGGELPGDTGGAQPVFLIPVPIP